MSAATLSDHDEVAISEARTWADTANPQRPMSWYRQAVMLGNLLRIIDRLNTARADQGPDQTPHA